MPPETGSAYAGQVAEAGTSEDAMRAREAVEGSLAAPNMREGLVPLPVVGPGDSRHLAAGASVQVAAAAMAANEVRVFVAGGREASVAGALDLLDGPDEAAADAQHVVRDGHGREGEARLHYERGVHVPQNGCVVPRPEEPIDARSSQESAVIERALVGLGPGCRVPECEDLDVFVVQSGLPSRPVRLGKCGAAVPRGGAGQEGERGAARRGAATAQKSRTECGHGGVKAWTAVPATSAVRARAARLGGSLAPSHWERAVDGAERAPKRGEAAAPRESTFKWLGGGGAPLVVAALDLAPRVDALVGGVATGLAIFFVVLLLTGGVILIRRLIGA
jgi:hypothetical protein